MPKYILAKPSASKVLPGLKKTCAKCGKSKLVKDFILNKKWKLQNGRDAWCKLCVTHLKSKLAVREYFWLNNRVFTEDIWNKAVGKAQAALITNPVYCDASEAKQNAMTLQVASGQVASFVNEAVYLKHDESYVDAKAAGKVLLIVDPNKKLWSPLFQGYFTIRLLLYLNDYYKKLSDDMNFDTESTRDYAQKVCKASLIANKAMDDYRAGKCDLSSMKDALNTFDLLSKSANFAACKRKPGLSTGLTSWSLTALYLLTHGMLRKDLNEWLQDVIDRVIADYYHIVAAVGLDETL